MPPELQTWLIPALILLLLAAVVWRIAVIRRRRIIRLPPRAAPKPAPEIPPAAAPEPVAASISPPVAGQVTAAPEAPPPLSPMAAPGGPPDDLQQIKGIGPKLVTLLNSLGVTRFDQIAGWSAEELAAIDARLGNFQGRPMRDRWQEQARLLASRDLKAFERLHGKIGDQA